MKLLTAALLINAAVAFAPSGKISFGIVSPSRASSSPSQINMADDNVPFFASKPEEPTESDEEDSSLEDEVEQLTKDEVAKTIKVSNLRNANGVDYAPWMKMSAQDEVKIQQVMKEKAAARRNRKEQEKSVSGNLYLDSQAQELSGTGLIAKAIDGGEVELEWATKTERNTKGFVVKRRPAKTEEFTVIASHENWGPLASKGKEGGVYRYLDTTSTPGGWVYRISECDNNGNEADLCQCLIEVQTEDEQKAALFAGVGIVVIGVAAVVAGLVLDPYAV
eukprot:scaffold409_cov295-Chaetoceros_neogracile.AAC.13